MNNYSKTILSLFLLVFFNFCVNKNEHKLLQPHKKFIDHVIEKQNSFYSITKSAKSKPKKNLAIGVFDSGIGGLTVFDAIANADYYNASHKKEPDGEADFNHEQFVYLADQANMPYSNYVEEGKKELLVEHVLKDALFLLNDRFHLSDKSPEYVQEKSPIKAMVIACNTATAYGKPQVEELCQIINADIKVIGVIDAGCEGALEIINKDENATIAILATPATVESEAYVKTLKTLKKDHNGTINFVQQGGKGLHESIDNKSEFINHNYYHPYPEYQGPSLYNSQYNIEKELLPYYNFDTTNFQMLYNKDNLIDSDTININSVDNYTRYHIVSLMENLKVSKNPIPLKAIILGCTHYPYVLENINKILNELSQTERYRFLLSDSVHIVDPAVNTAKELYQYLSKQDLFNNSNENLIEESQFFLSLPNTFQSDVETQTDGRFTYQYQYRERNINELKDYTLVVPFSIERISKEQLNMIQTRLPVTYQLVKKYINNRIE